VQCLKLTIKGTTTGFTGKLSECSDVANTGGRGTLSYNLTNETGTITWGVKKVDYGTTTVGLTYHVVTPSICPKKYEEYSVTSTVTGGTGAALASIPVGNQGTSGMCSRSSSWPTPLPKPLPWKFLYKDYSFYL